jgi:hypothetical protein
MSTLPCFRQAFEVGRECEVRLPPSVGKSTMEAIARESHMIASSTMRDDSKVDLHRLTTTGPSLEILLQVGIGG